MDSHSSHAMPSSGESSSNNHASTVNTAPQPANNLDQLVSEATQALALLQVGPSTFTGFPNMPAELRLKIWRHTFKEVKAVCLEHEVYSRDPDDDDAVQAFILEMNQRLPAALFVNHESRAEALNTHTIIHRSSMPAPLTKYSGGHPICAQSSDTFWISFPTLLNDSERLLDFLTRVRVLRPGFLERITKLEVRGTFVRPFVLVLLDMHQDLCLRDGDVEDIKKMKFVSFCLFTALKEVNLTGVDGDDTWTCEEGMENLEKLKKWLTGFFVRTKSVFDGGEAPTVNLRPFKTFEELINE